MKYLGKSREIKHIFLLIVGILGVVALFGAILPLEKNLEHMYVKSSAIILLVLVVIVLFVVGLKQYIWKEKRIVLVLFAVISIAMIVMIVWKSYPSHLLYYRYLMYLTAVLIPIFLVLLFHTMAWCFAERLENVYARQKKQTDKIALFSIILMAGLVFFCSPLKLHVSNVDAMPFPGGILIFWHLIYALAASAVLFFLYLFSPKRMRVFFAVFFTVLVLVLWIYTYILHGNYGVLDISMLTKPGRLAGFKDALSLNDIVLVLVELTALGAFASGVVFFWKKQGKQIAPLLVILLAITFGQTFFDLFTTENFWGKSNVSTYIPIDAERTFQFSRNGNIVVFMLDMFGADLVPRIMEEYPDIKEALKGFIWYPDTIPTGNATYAGLPAILAGDDFAPLNVNKQSDRLMSDMYEEAYAWYPGISKERGYDMTLVFPSYFHAEKKAEEWDINVSRPERYMEYWMNTSREGAHLNLRQTPAAYTKRFSVIGMFKASPFFLRPTIYMDSLWLMTNRGNQDVTHTIIHLGFLDLLDTFSHVDNGPPTFKMIINELTHTPWCINENLELEGKSLAVYTTEQGVSTPDDKSNIYTAARALKEIVNFLNWLEQAGIRDNTKIVLVSDHGYTGINSLWPELPVIQDSDGHPIEGSARVNSLLMVKNYNANKPWSIDTRLMSSADTPEIAWSTPEHPGNDPTVAPETDRSVSLSFTPTFPGQNGKYKYKIRHQFLINGDPSKPENWQQTIP